MDKEIWKPIKGFEGLYEVSNLGRIKSCDKEWAIYRGVISHRKGQIMKDKEVAGGYMQISLSKNGKQSMHLTHRLVASAFVDNIDNKPHVNHKDGNKKNNHADNLEWVTPSENQIHSRDVLHRRYHSRPVICIETGERFNSIVQASKLTNTPMGNLCSCCTGNRERAGGYHWRYADE